MCCQIDVLSMCVIVVILVCQTGTELSAGGRACETFIQVGLCGCRNSHLCPFPIVSTNDPWNDEEKPRSSPDDATARSVRMMALATAIPTLLAVLSTRIGPSAPPCVVQAAGGCPRRMLAAGRAPERLRAQGPPRRSQAQMLAGTPTTPAPALFDNELNLIYDSKCAVCQWEVDFLRSRDERGRLTFTDLESEAFEEGAARNGRLDYATALSSFHAVRADGELLSGVESFRAAYDAVGLGWVWALYDNRIVAAFLDAGYALFARYRTDITRGSTIEALVAARSARQSARPRSPTGMSTSVGDQETSSAAADEECVPCREGGRTWSDDV